MISRYLWLPLALLFVCDGALQADDTAAVRFAAIDILLESDEPIAAWQFELTERNGSMTVVGVENGDSPAFRDAPYFDREAVQLGTADRLIVADYSLAASDTLPQARTRICRIHIRISGNQEVDYELRLIAAANTDGINVDAELSFEIATGS